MKYFFQNLTKYVQAKADLAKMDTQETLIKVLFLVVQLIIVGTMLILVLIFSLLGLIFYFNYLLGNNFAGFFVLSGLILLIMVGYFILQKIIIKLLLKMARFLIRIVTKFLLSKQNIIEED